MAPPPSRHLIRPLATAAAALALLLAPASASAANWLAPQTFAAPGASATQGHVDGQGNMTGVWQDTSGTAGACAIRGVDRAGGAFQSVQTISDSGSVPACGDRPMLAANANGDAIVAWTSGANVFAARRQAGGAWSAPAALDAAASGFSDPRVALDASGDAVAVWLQGSTTLRTARWGAAAAAPTGAATVSDPGPGFAPADPSVGIDASGNTRALWEEYDGVATASLRAATGGPGADLAPDTLPIDTSTQVRYQATQVKPDGQGHWLGTWRESGASGVTLASAFASTATGAFARDSGQFSGGSQHAIDPPGIAFTADGTAILVWSYKDLNDKYQVLGLTRPATVVDWTATPPSGTLVGGPPTVARQYASTGSVVIDAGGRLQVVYEAGGSALGRQGAGLQTLQNAVTLGSGSGPFMARGAIYGAAVWTAGALVDLSVFDTVAPGAPVISAPASVPELEPAAFSATASDEFGPVSIEWAFGDGTTAGGPVANGAQVTHTYAAAGFYPVTARAIDGGGNTSSSTITFPVTTAPGNPGGGGGGGGGRTLPPPKAGVNANLVVVRGSVLVKTPGSSKFVPLTDPAQLSLGTIVDARRGRVRIAVANPSGGVLEGIAYQGRFVLTQTLGGAQGSKVSTSARAAAATLTLYGSNYRSCRKRAKKRGSRSAVAAKKKKRPTILGQVWTKGTFKTKGKYAATIVRGTEWLTADRCDGTLVRVRSGSVSVRDLVRKRTVVVKARRQYLARGR